MMSVDWTKPIEALLEDGSVVPAKVYSGPDNECDYEVDYADRTRMYVKPNGNVYGLDVVIRNVAEPAKPVRTAAEMLDRMEALVRRLATGYVAHSVSTKEARAIVAEMTPPIDPDLVEARAICARNVVQHNDGMVPGYQSGEYDGHWLMRCVVDGIKYGRSNP